MDRYQFAWEKTPEGGARLLRMKGAYSCLALPEQIGGFPLTELGDYCFAPEGRLPEHYQLAEETVSDDEKKKLAPAIAENMTAVVQQEEENNQGRTESLREIGGSYLERIVLPDSLRRIGRYAFYNCKQLTLMTIGKELTEAGSDAFMNCHRLQNIHLRARPEEKTGVRLLLAQITSDIEVAFDAGGECKAELLFPEYYENYDEIAPAHIFGRNITGEGFRARQCFADGIVDFKQYDTIFPKACAEESEETLCTLAWNRLRYPVDLGEQQRSMYETYCRGHAEVLQKRFVKKKSLEELQLLGTMGFFDREELEGCIRLSAAEGWIKGTAELQQMKQQLFPVQSVKSRYTFEEF